MAPEPDRESVPDADVPIEAIRSAEGLADLVSITGADSEHEAYFAAKRAWAAGWEPPIDAPDGGLPGTRVDVDGHAFHVHGITHADTDAEGTFLREHVSRFLDRGATVYCEQGIRPMYFDDLPAVCAMDDYRWAMNRCRELGEESYIADLPESAFDGLAEEVDSTTARFREAAFSIIESGEDLYGERFARVLGDVASGLLTSHEDMATGDDFEAFARTRRAATDPDRLADLQRYYERAFLPQPLEREWLRRHDRELELVTHGRNERQADYAVYHNEDAAEVHLIVGAAHGPGVRYYLERHRDGERDVAGFEPVG